MIKHLRAFARQSSHRIARASLLSVTALAFAVPACAQDVSFQDYLQSVKSKARAEGVREATIDAAFSGLTPNQRVLALDRDNISSGGASSGFPPLAPYIARHNSAARIVGGNRAFSRMSPVLQQVERRYGVAPEIVTAIWGHETSYGAVKGDFSLFRSLATLAWDGRRRELFEGELIATLKIADRGVASSSLIGSWAGAFGHPQFLPSVYLEVAVDGDGNGVTDIVNSEVDALHSIGNYFRNAGWHTGQPWGVRAFTPNSVDRSRIASKMAAPKCPRVFERFSKWMTVAEWRAMGVIPQAPIGDDVMASLFEPDGPAAPGYLVTQNYRVILEYNCSNYYAMSVGLLADEIRQ